MNEGILFWAQALDNASPDHIKVYRENSILLDVHPQDVVSKITNVIRTARYVSEHKKAKLTANEDFLVLEVLSVERDDLGRVAPIVCHAHYDSEYIDRIENQILNQLCEFAQGIGRELSLDLKDEIHETFEELKHQKVRRKRMKVHALVGVALVPLVTFTASLAIIKHYFKPHSREKDSEKIEPDETVE